ncbi:nuclear transport factor 2 family protein [Clostridium tagluense]|uniref:nuclear transport factor 2 family protein n=1 Tax=Clostridium tagluense TaxID=360422 RepID=UPI001C0DB51A|nr:nuclear transport factor 2 family protein [Clostridium tagluense]MBU3130544.1 nuclear transport factor 2 family protein [Clostridium tagluense]
MKNEINNELREVLNVFEEAYIQRDVSKVDSFMDALFDKDEKVIVLGTSCGELCLGHAEVKDIFLSDWEYWGDLRIKADEATIIPLGNTALIHTTGTIKYSFYSNEDTYTRHLGYIKQYFDGVSSDSKKPDKVKLTEINWKLCHLLNKWDGEERHYLWDLRISFVLIKKENRWIIRQMQFSLPVVGYMPDARIDNISGDIESFNAEGDKMKEYSINNTLVYKDEILKLLKDFNNEYLEAHNEIGTIASKYFTENPLIINTDKTVYSNQEEIKNLIENHRACYDEMKLDYEDCLINSNEDVVWIVTHGTMKKIISENSAFDNTVDIIKNIFTSDLDDKDKLFNIRRRIAGTFKENARGEEYVWPFRFEAVLIREKQNWVFKYIQFSLPFSWFLEGKTEAASIVK